MKYDVSAVEMLKMLGYDQPTGREWLEKVKQEKQISLLIFPAHFMTSYRK